MKATCGRCGATWSGYKPEHCQMCHETFSGTRSGDKHRVGRYEPMERRCLTPDEMRDKGMRQNSAGIWTTGGDYWSAT